MVDDNNKSSALFDLLFRNPNTENLLDFLTSDRWSSEYSGSIDPFHGAPLNMVLAYFAESDVVLPSVREEFSKMAKIADLAVDMEIDEHQDCEERIQRKLNSLRPKL